jgi:hypothetical protein
MKDQGWVNSVGPGVNNIKLLLKKQYFHTFIDLLNSIL